MIRLPLRRSLAALRERAVRWMLRTRVPEAQPVRLVQRRVYVLPTPAGLAMLVTLLLMLIGSINYTLSLGYALTFLLGAVWVAHILASWRCLVGLELHFRASGEAFAGGTAALLAQLGNAGTQPRHGITLSLADGYPLLLQADVPPRASTPFSLAWPVSRRGLHRPGRIVVESHYPLGWIRAWSYIEPDVTQLVLPQPVGELPLPHGSTTSNERILSTAMGDEDFAGLRSPQRGDPISRIAWKTLARSATPLVKHYQGGESQELVLDWQALPPAMPLEARLSQLTQWVLAARQAARPMLLRLPDGSLGPSAEPVHFADCLRRLALFGTREQA